jgi:uncharacterized membrane protein YfcA
MVFVGVGSIAATIALTLVLSVLTFVIAYRRNRRYFGRSVPDAVGVALAAAVLCPAGALLFYAISSTGPQKRPRRR